MQQITYSTKKPIHRSQQPGPKRRQLAPVPSEQRKIHKHYETTPTGHHDPHGPGTRTKRPRPHSRVQSRRIHGRFIRTDHPGGV